MHCFCAFLYASSISWQVLSSYCHQPTKNTNNKQRHNLNNSKKIGSFWVLKKMLCTNRYDLCRTIGIHFARCCSLTVTSWLASTIRDVPKIHSGIRLGTWHTGDSSNPNERVNKIPYNSSEGFVHGCILNEQPPNQINFSLSTKSAYAIKMWFFTLTHKKQKIWPHGNLLGWTQICKQTGHSITSLSVSVKRMRMHKIGKFTRF